MSDKKEKCFQCGHVLNEGITEQTVNELEGEIEDLEKKIKDKELGTLESAKMHARDFATLESAKLHAKYYVECMKSGNMSEAHLHMQDLWKILVPELCE